MSERPTPSRIKFLPKETPLLSTNVLILDQALKRIHSNHKRSGIGHPVWLESPTPTAQEKALRSRERVVLRGWSKKVGTCRAAFDQSALPGPGGPFVPGRRTRTTNSYDGTVPIF